jgi:hypothetical protein
VFGSDEEGQIIGAAPGDRQALYIIADAGLTVDEFAQMLGC